MELGRLLRLRRYLPTSRQFTLIDAWVQLHHDHSPIGALIPSDALEDATFDKRNRFTVRFIKQTQPSVGNVGTIYVLNREAAVFVQNDAATPPTRTLTLVAKIRASDNG